MANRNFANSRIYTGHVMPVLLDCNAVIGASGAVGTLKGPYVKSMTRLGVGAYQIQMQDSYNRYYGGFSGFVAAPTGAALDPNTGSVGQAYVITNVGNTNWSTAGLPKGVVPAVGCGLVLAAAPPAGTGRVKAIASSGIASIQVIGNQNLSVNPSPSSLQGAYILIQCFDSSGSPADPANGSVMSLAFYLSNSSVLINGE